MKIQIVDDKIPHDILKNAIRQAETCSLYGVLHPAGDGSYGFKYTWDFLQLDKPETFVDENIKALWDIVKQHIPTNHILRRGYINAHTFGVEDTIHFDDPNFQNGYTIIVYLCNDWYAGWSGQTVFYKNLNQLGNEIEQSVLPRYNRFVVFDKNLPHCVAPLSHKFAGVRLTCMFKIEALDESA